MSSLGTLLVIDDDETTTVTFAKILRVAGFEVQTALSAARGLQAAEAMHPDAVIVDLRMPLLDGLGFLRRLRSLDQHRQVPVAILTGDYLMDDVVARELKELGARVHFKPFWMEDLLALACSMLKIDRLPDASPALSS